MRYEIAFTQRVNDTLQQHLLDHIRLGRLQEDLCFALWRRSSAADRTTALLAEVLLPQDDERILHGNVSFNPDYLARAIATARRGNMGLAFLHSHVTPGWQEMSPPDVIAERDVLAYPAAATEHPLVGLTLGSDGSWSSRFWIRDGTGFERHWCDKVRIVGPSAYEVQHGRYALAAAPKRNILRRAFDTWGTAGQNTLSRLNVGIVGLGSVGSQVSEAMARIGVEAVTLVDPDLVEEHNLDRLLNATHDDIGKPKAAVAAEAFRSHSTAAVPRILALETSIHDRQSYDAILGCDVVFSCVDRPLARDVLNFVATAHLIPVIDGGVAVQIDPQNQSIFSAHWKAILATPYHQCMRCREQYSTGMVVAELDGSLDDPAYITNLPAGDATGGANVYSFSQALAATEVNLFLRYLLAPSWWRPVHSQTHYAITGMTETDTASCAPGCAFRPRVAMGDLEEPFYLIDTPGASQTKRLATFKAGFNRLLDRLFRRA